MLSCSNAEMCLLDETHIIPSVWPLHSHTCPLPELAPLSAEGDCKPPRGADAAADGRVGLYESSSDA